MLNQGVFIVLHVHKYWSGNFAHNAEGLDGAFLVEVFIQNHLLALLSVGLFIIVLEYIWVVILIAPINRALEICEKL